MSFKKYSYTLSQDRNFKMALGWLTAAAVSIVMSLSFLKKRTAITKKVGEKAVFNSKLTSTV